MNLPCWDVVGFSKRNLAQEGQREPSTFNTVLCPNSLNLHSSSRLIHLPGELRNKILGFCVDDATFCPRCLQRHDIVADVSRNMQIRGIGPLPLIFASKQINNEVLSLVYFRLKPVEINGYFHVFQPSSTSLLPSNYPAVWPRHPHVQHSARSISITMSYWKTWEEGSGSWCDFTSDRQLSPKSSAVAKNADLPFSTNRAVIRRLAKYLRTFKSLVELEIIVDLHRNVGGNDGVHGLHQLLPLYDLQIPSTTVKFKMQVSNLRGNRPRGSGPPKEVMNQAKNDVLDWMCVWKNLLACHRRQSPEAEICTEDAPEGSASDACSYVVESRTKFSTSM